MKVSGFCTLFLMVVAAFTFFSFKSTTAPPWFPGKCSSIPYYLLLFIYFQTLFYNNGTFCKMCCCFIIRTSCFWLKIRIVCFKHFFCLDGFSFHVICEKSRVHALVMKASNSQSLEIIFFLPSIV